MDSVIIVTKVGQLEVVVNNYRDYVGFLFHLW